MEKSTEDRDESEPQTEEADTSSGGGAFSLWGLGASVLGNVQKNTSTFVNTIVETDWKKELQEIQDGLRTETAELEKDIGNKLGIAPAEQDTTDSSTRAAPGAEADGVTIADIGRRFLTGTAEILQQVRATVDNEFTNLEQEAVTKKPRSSLPRTGREGGAKFSRLDMKISAMQRNSATYCDEPEDAEAFSAFLAEYDEEARTTQAEGIMSSNPFMAELHSRLVPLVITDDTFWQRYFFRLQKLTEEYEKVQERLQQAHRRASKQELDSEPLEPIIKPEPTPAAASPATALKSMSPATQNTPGEGPAGDGERLEAQQNPAAATQQDDVDGAQSGGGLRHPEDCDDDVRVEGAAEHTYGDVPAEECQNGEQTSAGVRESAAVDRTQPSGHVGAAAVGVVGGDADEGVDSARSSGNEKLSSDWSVVSGNGNGTCNGAAPEAKVQTQQPEDVPTEAQEAAANPAGTDASIATTPEQGDLKAADEEEQDEDVDFDELEDGEGDEEGGEEDLDDNWGWE